EVELADAARHQHAPYPPPHRYVDVGHGTAAGVPGLLVGTTPVTENEGLGWPLTYLSEALRPFRERRLPIHALGVGVDALESRKALRLFRRTFEPVTSWVVRSDRCRDALLSMGVSGDRIAVGADWAWLHTPAQDLGDWAAGVWRSLGVDLDRPLLVANVVNLRWRRRAIKRRVAAALDRAASRMDAAIAFFCNECR